MGREEIEMGRRGGGYSEPNITATLVRYPTPTLTPYTIHGTFLTQAAFAFHNQVFRIQIRQKASTTKGTAYTFFKTLI